jgi:hypothetical protein
MEERRGNGPTLMLMTSFDNPSMMSLGGHNHHDDISTKALGLSAGRSDQK